MIVMNVLKIKQEHCRVLTFVIYWNIFVGIRFKVSLMLQLASLILTIVSLFIVDFRYKHSLSNKPFEFFKRINPAIGYYCRYYYPSWRVISWYEFPTSTTYQLSLSLFKYRYGDLILKKSVDTASLNNYRLLELQKASIEGLLAFNQASNADSDTTSSILQEPLSNECSSCKCACVTILFITSSA